MAGVSFAGVELRKLPASFRIKLGQILDLDESWKKLMCRIPSELNPTGSSKYSAEDVFLVERHARKTGAYGGEILLDEWSTSGKNRPTAETLLHLLIQCNLFRAADYVATEILGEEPPQRPDNGPAARVKPDCEENTMTDLAASGGADGSADRLQDVLERLNNHDSSQGNLIPFHIAVIEAVTKNFHQEFCIGHGAFGTVYKMDLTRNGGPMLAIKLLNPVCSVVEDQFLTEIRVLSEYRHENLLCLIGYCTNGPQYCLIYEYMSNGSLLDMLQNEPNRLEWRKRVSILSGVAKGILYLHTARDTPLIHRDIKSANILLSDNLSPRIGDFGLAKSLSSSNQTSALTSTIFGTSAYMAPEAFRGDISPKMDIFSFGVRFQF
ncbi:interleukin-1 receptor-associated kinase 4 isoform X2 [Folsomia candida]|uniref:interleukin-1 receptor-associated kinase 4 isoform X2 n=1 Tax=Folsomia candida TaxID=158441 RepID=UPI0016051DFA|nr:interleukin-1 receptor-associated kinase 4 isoform X2 [Folsomia candida]